MITFSLSFLALILGYLFYGRFVAHIFGPDDRVTPAVAKADGMDYIVLPNWKVFMIQFLNIAGTGPIFGAIMGARHGGASLPELVGAYLGKAPRAIMLVFTVLLLIMTGTVFVYSPAEILHTIGGETMMWVGIIFVYYIIATMLPIDKIIGKIYPLFAFSLLFMAAALMIVLFVKMPHLPELWTNFYNMGKEAQPEKWTDAIFPALFITIACGAISGFHATQSPLMARCVKSEKMGRPIFYGAMITEGMVAGAMITEGMVALIWATVSMWFFYDAPTPGYELIAGAEKGFYTSAPAVVNLVCNDWLGVVGAILAMLGVVAAPITSGDTAFRSARLIVAEWLKANQRPIAKRLMICVPMFALSIAMLVWQIENPDGFNTIWQYFGWSNQTLSVFTLWTVTVYLVRNKRCYWITLIPALFMTTVCSTYAFVSKQMFGLGDTGYIIGLCCLGVAAICFGLWYNNESKKLNK